MRRGMDIDQAQEPDYDSVKIDYVGFVDLMQLKEWLF